MILPDSHTLCMFGDQPLLVCPNKLSTSKRKSEMLDLFMKPSEESWIISHIHGWLVNTRVSFQQRLQNVQVWLIFRAILGQEARVKFPTACDARTADVVLYLTSWCEIIGQWIGDR